MLKLNLSGDFARLDTPWSYKTQFFIAVLALLFGCALPAQSQIFKVPVVYPSGGSSGESIAVADINNDGKQDVIVADDDLSTGGSLVGVLLGNGDGTLQTVVTYALRYYGADAVAVKDLNGDGWPDLVVGTSDGVGATTLSVLLNKGDGTFQAAVEYSSGGWDATSVAVADVDGDGKTDLVVANQCADFHCNSNSAAVLLGNGDGTFRPAVTYTISGIGSVSLAVADLNGDDKLDLVVGNEDSSGNCSIAVLLNKGDGTFPTQTTYLAGRGGPNSIILLDVNGDGKLDAAVATGNSVVIVPGNGDGTFGAASAYPAGQSAWSLATGDFNGDSTPDLVVSNSSANGKIAVLLNNGDGTFKAPITYGTGGKYAVSVAVANLSRNPKPDVVAVDVCDGFQNHCPLGGGVAVFMGVPATTKTTLTTSGSPSQYGQPVTFTATITAAYGPIPNGTTVTFYNNLTKMGTAATVNGTAQFTTSSLKVGSHPIKASYPSSPFFKASSGTVSQVVN